MARFTSVYEEVEIKRLAVHRPEVTRVREVASAAVAYKSGLHSLHYGLCVLTFSALCTCERSRSVVYDSLRLIVSSLPGSSVHGIFQASGLSLPPEPSGEPFQLRRHPQMPKQ